MTVVSPSYSYISTEPESSLLQDGYLSLRSMGERQVPMNSASDVFPLPLGPYITLSPGDTTTSLFSRGPNDFT